MNEREIFLAALSRDDPGSRSEYLADACAGDPALRERVEGLLRAVASLGSFLEGRPPGVDPEATQADAPAPGPGAPGAGPGADAAVGRRIGPYKLLQLLGEGGMGAVYMAEQEEPVRRKVALKLIRPGAGGGNVLARFEAERQALALMDHPNIAKVLDAGTADDGQPYFVMELVRGVPITRYCDEARLSPRERLELFLPACRAIQHAHQKGVIHRDIKPSNVLVALYDGRPVPKVIDFGIAKAVDQRLTERTLFTQFGAIVGTPEYMSPEQAELNQLDVDTRSDVYGLGVLLYELLTGTTPLDRETLRRAAFDEILRRIREEEPARPSTRLSASGERLATLSALRRTDPGRLAGMVRGEPDWIVMKALEKDRARRYESAVALARDVERHLSGEAVEACPPSRLYRLGKFARRHRAALATAGAFAVLLVAATAVSLALAAEASRQRARAERQRAEAEAARAGAIREAARAAREAEVAGATSAFLREDLLARAGPDAEPDRDLTVRAALDRAAEAIGGRFEGRPEVEAAIRETIGRTYQSLGLPDRARPHLERSLELRRAAAGPDDPETLGAMDALAETYAALGLRELAEPLYLAALEGARRAFGPDRPETAIALHDLARFDLDLGRPAEAGPRLEEALAILRRAGDAHREGVYRVLGALGAARHAEGRPAEAEPPIREALQGWERDHGPDHPEALRAANALAAVLRARGGFAEAEALYRRALEGWARLGGPEHPDTLNIAGNLVVLLQAAGRPGEALPLARQTREAALRAFGAEHPVSLRATLNLAAACRETGELEEAEALLGEGLGALRRVRGPDHPENLAVLNILAAVALARDRTVAAEGHLRDALDLARKVRGTDHPDTLLTENNLAKVLDDLGRRAEAEALYRRAVGGSRRVRGPVHPETLRLLTNLGLLLQKDGRPADAEAPFREALDGRAAAAPDHWARYRDASLLGEALLDQGRTDEAGPLLLEGFEGLERRLSATPPVPPAEVARAARRLAALAAARGRPDEAGAWRRRAAAVDDLPADVFAP